IAMTRVHVRLNLEHESGEPLVGRVHDARIARALLRGRRELDERLKERLEAEVGQRAAEEDRGLTPYSVFREIERRTRFADDGQGLAEMGVEVASDHLSRIRIVE